MMKNYIYIKNLLIIYLNETITLMDKFNSKNFLNNKISKIMI